MRVGTSRRAVLKDYFTKSGEDVFSDVEWETRRLTLNDSDGSALLDREIEMPTFWSQTAGTIAAYKYLRKRGVGDSEGSESSIRQLIHRVAKTIRVAGEEQGVLVNAQEGEIFERELKYILLHQKAAFNSPVWFNVGLYHEYGILGKSKNFYWNPETKTVEIATDAYEHPQASACFIQSVKDDLGDIFDLLKKEAQLFKYGSGTGTNFSSLRSRYEKLSGGGTSSGVLSFLKVYDSGAGATKSGGTTRRAAKMVILDVDHPEVMDFIHWKEREEEKARILIEYGGLPSDFNGEAYKTVGGQNSNNSVRVTDDFMHAYETDGSWDLKSVTTGEVVKSLPARQIMREIAEAAWRCADPGMQYDTTINRWHTSKNSGRINASNPCSEYMFLDDSACNLASINLVTYLNDDYSFDIEGFRQTVDILITAQEILVDLSSYPGRAIAQNSHDYRPLGLGYANLGAYLMRIGLPYDSEEARGLAGAITALLTGEAYAQSARLAERVGPFSQFEKNRAPMLEVIDMHRAELDRVVATSYSNEILRTGREVWEEAYDLGSEFGYRNAQTTVLAPTGTIGPLMDVDTTGIEPDYALVKYKKLAGGGGYSIVNQSVGPALTQLGYTDKESEAICNYILEHGTIEGAPGIKERDLAVFDCANRCGDGVRFIRPMAHVEMMAAVQPFISGAISKTVNLPEETTVDEVEKVYVESWRMGLKALALYRDNCKASQPLTVKKSTTALRSETETLPEEPPKQRVLPKTRSGITHAFTVGGHKVYITANHYADGQLAEIFLKTAREGSAFSGMMDTLARLMSKALQRGESVESLVDSLLNMRFEPWGATDDMEIAFAKSIPDYIARWLAKRYMPMASQVQLGITAQPAPTEEVDQLDAGTGEGETVDEGKIASEIVQVVRDSSAQICPTCGALMVRSGTCYACRQCGTTTSCG